MALAAVMSAGGQARSARLLRTTLGKGGEHLARGGGGVLAAAACLATALGCGSGQSMIGDKGMPSRGTAPWVKHDSRPDEIDNFGIQCIVYSGGLREVREPFVLPTEGGFLLFHAVVDQGTIALTRSSDGIAWGRAEVVLTATESWEGGRVGAPSVLALEGGEILMWYEGAGGIGLARSADGGGRWSKVGDGGGPVLAPEEAWEAGRVGAPAVAVDPQPASEAERYRMWYEGGAGEGIGTAVSRDGERWTRVGAGAPIVARGGAGEWDEAWVGSPAADSDVTLGRRRFLVWYTGMAGNDWSIGYAGSFDGIVWEKYGSNPVLNEYPPLTLTIPVDEREPTIARVGSGRWMWFAETQNFPPDQGVCLATQAVASP